MDGQSMAEPSAGSAGLSPRGKVLGNRALPAIAALQQGIGDAPQA